MEHQFGAMTIEQGKARGVAGGDTFLKSVYIQRKTIRESKIHGLENEIRELKALLTKGNRLIYEKVALSPAACHNPVDLFAWGPEAFQKAQREQQPVFLSIGYS
jgi:hypothetical protein